jgi:hypothetical protein
MRVMWAAIGVKLYVRACFVNVAACIFISWPTSTHASLLKRQRRRTWMLTTHLSPWHEILCSRSNRKRWETQLDGTNRLVQNTLSAKSGHRVSSKRGKSGDVKWKMPAVAGRNCTILWTHLSTSFFNFRV